MAGSESGNSYLVKTCSICLEPVSDTHERSIAKLICGHQFHLDCIGSAFNAKGSMQCPNCRLIENGDWLYGNGRGHFDHSMLDHMNFEDEYDLVLSLFLDGFMIPPSLWCPYQGSYTQSLGNGDHLPIAYGEVIINSLPIENFEWDESVQPHLAQAQGLSTGVDEDVQAQQNSSHLHPTIPHWQHFTPPSGQWGHRSSAFIEPIGVAGRISRQGGSRWHQSQNQPQWYQSGNPPAGGIQPFQSWHDGRRRRSRASTPAVFSPRPARWNYPGISTVQDAQSTNFRQRRRNGSSRFQQYPSEAGVYGSHGTLGSQLPTQVASLDHHAHATSQALHPYPSAQEMDAPP